MQDFEYFKDLLSEFLTENKFTFIYFFEIWLSKMEQMISIEARYLLFFKIIIFYKNFLIYFKEN